MDRRSKRDPKFLIFQSLYIIAISILFYKGTDLALNKVVEKRPGDTVIAIIDLDTTSKPTYDSSTQIVMKKLAEDDQYKTVTLKDTIVPKETLTDKDKRISVLERMKTPTNVSRNTRTPTESVPKSDVTGGRPVEK